MLHLLPCKTRGVVIKFCVNCGLYCLGGKVSVIFCFSINFFVRNRIFGVEKVVFVLLSGSESLIRSLSDLVVSAEAIE